jgi:sec-independent protein translocase protein TatB
MFDIGFWELILIGVIALIVFGPERLPAIATRIGHWVGRGRALMRAVQMQLEQELEAGKAGVNDALPKFEQENAHKTSETRAKEPAADQTPVKKQESSGPDEPS